MATPVSDAFPAVGTTVDSLDPRIAGLAQGGAWSFGSSAHVLTYALHDVNFGDLVQGWTPIRIATVAQAFAAWSAVADIRFTRVATTADIARSPADLALAFQSFGTTPGQGNEIAAFGFFPDPDYINVEILPTSGDTRSSYPRPEGDIYFNIDYANRVDNGAGSYWFLVALHEIGHTLGLKHPHDDGGNARPTFVQLGIAASDDGYDTVMSYNDPPRPTPNAGYQVTPMPLDILAIQAIYGANNSYRLDDTVWSGADNQTVRTIWDAGGNDTIDFSGANRSIQIDLQDTGGHLYEVGNLSAVAIAYGVAIENVTGSRFADTMSGTEGANVLRGNGGADFLAGLGGDDLLDGGAGTDTLSGGAGDDTYVVDSAFDVIIEAPVLGPPFGPGEGGVDEVRSSIAFVLPANLENLILTGGGAVDGTGNDGVNVLQGNAAANVLRGLGGDDRIDGAAGADLIDGGVGNDQMAGGAGDDTYVVGQAGDLVTELPGEGRDLVSAAVDFTLPDNVEDLVLDGGAQFGNGNDADNRLTGNDGDNILTGRGGNDLLDGGAGADTLEGGDGNDTYMLDNPGDHVVEAPGGGIDTVLTAVAFTMPDTIENVTLVGFANLSLAGNAADNALYGNAGANRLDGGPGSDTLVGGPGDDTYVVDNNDTVIELPAAGTDELQFGGSGGSTLGANLENLGLAAGAGALSAMGNGVANVITGNASRNVLDGGDGGDTLLAGAGDDTLQGGAGDDLLDGERGADMMVGGTGNDTYRVDHTRDVVAERAGEGVDTVFSTLRDYTLPANVEILVLAGSGLQNGAGNDLANTINGSTTANHLTGGGGGDRFVFDDAPGLANVDTITDFSSGTDRVVLDHIVFGGLAPGALGSATFRAGPDLQAGIAPGDRVLFDTTTGTLSFDADGSGAAAAVAFAVLAHGATIAAGDILVM